MSRFYNIGEIMLSGIPSGCVLQGDSVPGVSASLQPPATFCDRFAIKIIGHLKQLVPPSGDDLKPHDFTEIYRYPRWVPRSWSLRQGRVFSGSSECREFHGDGEEIGCEMGWKPNSARPCRRLQDRGTPTCSLAELKTVIAHHKRCALTSGKPPIKRVS